VAGKSQETNSRFINTKKRYEEKVASMEKENQRLKSIIWLWESSVSDSETNADGDDTESKTTDGDNENMESKTVKVHGVGGKKRKLYEGSV
jgi:hypothetical protein